MSSSLKLTLSTAAVALLTLVPAVIEGGYMRRWGVGADLATAGRTVDELPKSIGPWEFVEFGDPLSDIAISDLGVEGYTNRVYRHRGTGRTATLLLMVGKPGPLVRHPPNICYANQNNRQIGATELVSVGSPPASEFKLLHFERESFAGRRFMVAYSHTIDGVWRAPAVPRLLFGGEPLLYKVQVLASQGTTSGRDDLEALEDFLGQFVAAFSRQLSMD
jgi:hypothetical protein